MEGDKKRKRAASETGHPHAGGHWVIDNSASTSQITADGAPAVRLGPGATGKTKHAGGRPHGGHAALTTLEVRVRRGRAKDKTASLALADQVRLVVSAALDFPRIPVSSSATSLIHV